MASDKRSITTVLRAETGQYERSMDSAAKATAKVGDAAGKASKQTEGLGKSGKGIGDGATAGAKKGTSALDQMAASVEKNEAAWQGVGTTLTVAGGAVTAFGIAAVKTGIEYNTLQQTSRAALESLLGSAQAANEQMDKLDDFARTSPFAKSTFIEAQQQMLAFGIEAEKVVPYLDAIQNAVAAAGGSNNDIAEISTVFSKIQSSAKITAQDLQELGNRGVNAAELIGSQMGMTGAQVRESITAGTLDAQTALDALADGMSTRFAGAADGVKNTFAGAVDRVKAAWRDFSSELAAPLVDPEGGGALVDMLNGIADAMRGFQGLPDPVKDTLTLMAGFGGVATAAAGGLILMAPKVAELVTNFSAWRKSAPVVSGALGDMGKAVGGVMAVVSAFQLLDAATRNTGPSIAEIENRLVAISDEGANAGSVLKGVQSDFDPMSMSPLQEPKTEQDWQNLLGYLDDMSSGFGKVQGTLAGWLSMNDDVENTKAALEGTGTALAEMASTDLSGAQQGFKQFVDQAGGGEEVTRQLLKYMPAYRDALMEQATAAGMATDEQTLLKIATGEMAIEAEGAATASVEFASAQEQLAAALESADPQIAAQAGAYRDLIDGVGKASSAFLDFTDDLGEAEFSLDGWLDKLEEQASAQEKWADNIAKLAKRGASTELLQGLIDQGPKAANAVNALANGTEGDMKRAEEAVGGVTDATTGLQDALGQEFVVKLSTDAAKQGAKSTEEYISGLSAAITVTGNTVPAREEGESAEAYISRLRAVLGVDADGNPARKDGEEAKSYIDRLTAKMRVDGDNVPARKKGESADAYISRLEAKMGIDGDNAEAKRKGKEAQSDIDGRDATIDVDADTSSARQSVGSWLSSIPRTITTNIQQVIHKKTLTSFAGGRPAKAAGGPISGPGTGTSDDVPIMASNGEHMWTAREVQAVGGHSEMERLRAAARSGDLPEYATGGAIGSAASALNRARRSRNSASVALRRARIQLARAKRTKSEKDDARAQRRVDALEKTYAARQRAAEDQAARLNRLREERTDLIRDSRRGEVLSQATSGTSGAYSVVDQMYALAESGDLTRSQSRRLKASGHNAEKNMRRLYKQADALEKKLDSATERYEELLQIRDSASSSISGGFDLGKVTSPWTGGAATSGAEYLASTKAYAAKAKAFAFKLRALQKAGYSGVIMQEVAAMGVEEGTIAADALLQLSPTETKEMNTAYDSIYSWADKGANVVTEGFYNGGISAAKGLMKGLESQQKTIEAAILRWAKGMEAALKKALGIKSPSTVFRELGQYTGAGMVLGLEDSIGAVARASEQLAHVPGTVTPSVYTNPAAKAGASQVVAVVDKGAMAEAMNGMKMTLVADGKPITAIAQTTVDRNLGTLATSLNGGRR